MGPMAPPPVSATAPPLVAQVFGGATARAMHAPPVCVSGSFSGVGARSSPGVFAAAGHSAARGAAGGGGSLSVPHFPPAPTVVITV